MAENGTEVSTQPKARTPIRVAMFARVVLVILGISSWAVGGYAVFVAGRGEFGSVALVVGGMVCVILGLVGRVPRRLSGKDWSVDLDTVADATEDQPREERKRLANELVASSSSESDPSSRIAGRIYASLAFDEAAINAAIAALRSLPVEVEHETSLSTEEGKAAIDAIVKVGSFRVGIVAKYSSTAKGLRRSAQHAARAAKVLALNAVVVVSSQRVDIAAEDVVEYTEVIFIALSDIDLLPKYMYRLGFVV